MKKLLYFFLSFVFFPYYSVLAETIKFIGDERYWVDRGQWIDGDTKCCYEIKAIVHERVVGYIQLNLDHKGSDKIFHKEPVKNLHVNDMEVDQEMQRQGIGTLLLKEAIAYARYLSLSACAYIKSSGFLLAKKLAEKYPIIFDMHYWNPEYCTISYRIP